MGDVAVLRSGADYPIPDEALDDRLAFVGTAGSGKTYNSGSGVERVLAGGGRVVIPDPLGVWWGLGLGADGARPSAWRERLFIFGGEHGDLPLNEHHGALIGETAASMAESAILDLSGIGTKAAERRFMLAFLTAFYRHASGDPVHLVFDEADMWAPQRLLDKEGESAKLLGMMETVVRRGRIKGFIPWLITQRPAVLSKDVLSQADGLIAFKLTSSQDRAAIGDWIEGQGDRAEGKEILASLPTMQRGQGVVWVPGRGLLETASFPPKLTFDSSRTPKRGEQRERRDLKPVDLGKLQEKMAAVVEEAKANDPKALKAEVARLTRELTKASSQAPKASSGVPEWPDQREEVHDLGVQLEAALAERDHFKGGFEEYRRRIYAALSALGVETLAALDEKEWEADLKPAKAAPAPSPRRLTPAPAPVQRQPDAARAPQGESGGPLTGPQRRVLNALSWWQAFGIGSPSSEQVAFVAGYSASSSGFANLKGAMRSMGLIEYPSGGRVSLTNDGAAEAEAPVGPVTQAAFHDAVRAKLANPQLRLLDPLLAAYPEALSSADLAEAAGYSTSSSGFANLKGSMRSLGFVDYPTAGYVRAADWLFP